MSETPQTRRHGAVRKFSTVAFPIEHHFAARTGQYRVIAKTEAEPRYLVIGLIDGKHWSAVVTYRDENVRIISVRRSRTEEVALYES